MLYTCCYACRGDKDLEDSNGDDGWRFDGTVRHLPSGVVPGENGPVPDEKMTLPTSVAESMEQQQSSRSTPVAPSSPKASQPPPKPPSQQQQQPHTSNHIDQQVSCVVWLCRLSIFINIAIIFLVLAFKTLLSFGKAIN